MRDFLGITERCSNKISERFQKGIPGRIHEMFSKGIPERFSLGILERYIEENMRYT